MKILKHQSLTSFSIMTVLFALSIFPYLCPLMLPLSSAFSLLTVVVCVLSLNIA
ncbi:hypothetical protein C1646_710334 [Rhizophagus diaphanus]|nr:hypothetical protein C1646_710334 [Rhizophagus diaphanus] [Rhizophagus sp. MUCL 43196]